MKTRIYFLLIILLCIFTTSYSQIQVASNGHVSVGTTDSPTHYLDVYGKLFHFYRYPEESTYRLGISLYGTGPRLIAGDDIVFYNLAQNDFIDIQCGTVYESSDSSKKTNIKYIDSPTALEKVLQLNAVSYDWKESSTSSLSSKSASISSSSDSNSSGQIGYLAQEVEEVIPEVVFTSDSTDSKMVTYTHVIPYLSEAIKELNDKITELEEQLEESSTTLKSASSLISTDELESTKAVLYQNSPNPFTDNTVIKYVIPEDSHSASINIFNMQGQPEKYIEIYDIGEGEVTVYGSELSPGMYIYVLFVDGTIIDSKNMVLTN